MAKDKDSMIGKMKSKLSNAKKATGRKPSQGFGSKDIADMVIQVGQDEGIFYKSNGGPIKVSKYYSGGGTVFTGRN